MAAELGDVGWATQFVLFYTPNKKKFQFVCVKKVVAFPEFDKSYMYTDFNLFPRNSCTIEIQQLLMWATNCKHDFEGAFSHVFK